MRPALSVGDCMGPGTFDGAWNLRSPSRLRAACFARNSPLRRGNKLIRGVAGRKAVMKTIYGIVADMRFCPSVLAAAVLAVVVGPANAADDSIEEKAALCTPCHREAGISQTENNPALAGQPQPLFHW